MISEELKNKLNNISDKFQEYGFNLKEDLIELVELNENVAVKLEGTKFKKIHFFHEEESNSVGFTLEDIQVEFFVEYGEDEEGKWYEASAEIRLF
ncbi:hypothetical protein [Fusobacterium sp. PH5-44]|uniref:hypothetical protein n=1 Tax=unclassified Fusobacterium TaxID=2648384 RepID=UPI003D2416A7